MRNVSIYLDDALEKRLKEFPEINLSEVMRSGLISYLEKREEEEKLTPRVEGLEARIMGLESIVKELQGKWL